MILADDEAGRKGALNILLPMQKKDFLGIFKALDGLPVTIRTLDPPLHEFLPNVQSETEELAHRLGLSYQTVKARIDLLKEQNPMLGLRGCRLGILFPEITRMQARAIFEAAVEANMSGVEVLPEIMIPLVGHEKEFIYQKQIVDEVASEVFDEYDHSVDYLVGTMIELPRAALRADAIAKAGAQFFSFGTNDLTQTTFGLSRDDAGSFLNKYSDLHIWEQDPFVTLDQDGVGFLVELGVKKGRSTDPKLKIGICGEHGGDPSSVRFCASLNFDYVSCSPPRVPVARLSAAQYALEMGDTPKRAGRPRKKESEKAPKAKKAEPKKVGRPKIKAEPKKAEPKKAGRPKTKAEPKKAEPKKAGRPKKAETKKAAPKTKKAAPKAAPKKAPAKKAAPKKPAPKKPARKIAAKKPLKKATVKKAAPKKPVRKSAAKKPVKKTQAKKPRR
jgi:pyruvate,orthophosphate dikinase